MMQTATVQASEAPSPLDSLSILLDADMRSVNALIIDYMQSDVPLIPQLASYLIAAGGKRIRPLLTLASTALYGGDMMRAHNLAACVEFIHTATLLHDDVVDNSAERRGKPSANNVFGNEASVLVGDFLFSRSFQLMVKDGNLDILRILSDAAAIIAQGEVMQLTTQGNLDTTMDHYLDVIKGKTASLFAAACEVGPVIAGADKNAAAAMNEYGMKLGMAFQVVDDVLDYVGDQTKIGKTVGDDFREGKMSAPVIFALQNASTGEKEFWTRTLQEKQQTDNDLAEALAILNHHKALEKGMDLAMTYANDARQALALAPDSPVRANLDSLASFVVHRHF